MPAADFLLTTKLFLPPPRPMLVARPRLLDLLAQGLKRPLTLVSAPAGFGKTTLLSEWRASPDGRDFPLAWVSLDHEDNEPSRFLLYLAAALDTLKPGLAGPVLSALQSPQPPHGKSLLTSLVNDLSGLQEHFALVLDDYHQISAPDVHELLRFLLEAMPARMHLVILTRSDPPLPLARLRARDQLTEIRLPTLRFRPEEAARFLNEVMGLGLLPEDIAALESRTEGWIAGLQLAAVSLQQQPDRHAFVSAFAGDDRYVMDYLLEEVLQRQPADLQAFLLKTSILERLNGPLCQALTGEPASADILSRLEQANLFVTALDTRRYWFRYHPLFSDLLRHRLGQILPAEDNLDLHKQACAWFESEGYIAEAISQAFAAPNDDLAADLMERHGLTVFYRGETMLVHHWLMSLPESLLRRRPLLAALYANTCGHVSMYQPGSLGQSEAWLQTAEEALQAQTPGQPAQALTRSFIDLSHAYLALWKGDPPEAVIDLARKALAGLPPADEQNLDPNFQRFHSGLTNNLAISYMFLGKENEAARAFAEAERIGEACGDLLNYYSAIANHSMIMQVHGCLYDAAGLLKRALGGSAEAVARSERSLPYIGVVYFRLGQILLEWNDLDAAGQALERSLELSRLMAASDGQVETYIALVRLRQAQGRGAEALALLDQAVLTSSRARALVPAMRVRLLIARSHEQLALLEQASRWAEGRTFAEAVSFWGLFENLTLARLLIARRMEAARSVEARPVNMEPLMGFLQESLEWNTSRDRVEHMLELRILQALAWQAQNRLTEALESLRLALELGEAGGYVRLFLDEGLPMRKLLNKVKPSSTRFGEYVRKLLSAGGWGEHVAAGSVPQSSLVEPLSQRELEVLGLLKQGASNADISRVLVISLNTTKKHLTHIFEKLAVSDRAEAVRRAAELGLWPSDK